MYGQRIPATCGGGSQSQSVICQDSTGKTVDDSFCSGSKPSTSQTCNPQACLTYNWAQSGFGACSATCGGGTQTQTVTCKDNLGNTVNNSFCTGAMPATTQTCNPQACITYSWKQLGWSACSATCGGGTQTQSVVCQDSNGNTVANSYCASFPMPVTAQACNAQACPCAGVSVGGYCWYQGAGGQNCDQVCAGHGGNTAGTTAYAGANAGSCSNVLAAFGLAAARSNACADGYGCWVNTFGGGNFFCTSPAANTSAAYWQSVSRLCSCAN